MQDRGRGYRVGLRENGPDYRLFFETAVDGMLLAGADGKVIDANRRACDLLRRTREELAGLGSKTSPILHTRSSGPR